MFNWKEKNILKDHYYNVHVVNLKSNCHGLVFVIQYIICTENIFIKSLMHLIIKKNWLVIDVKYHFQHDYSLLLALSWWSSFNWWKLKLSIHVHSDSVVYYIDQHDQEWFKSQSLVKKEKKDKQNWDFFIVHHLTYGQKPLLTLKLVILNENFCYCKFTEWICILTWDIIWLISQWCTMQWLIQKFS